MSQKARLLKFQTITDGDMAEDSVTSTVTNIQNLDNIAIQAVWSGDPIGTFSVEVSIDHAQDANGNVTVAGTWTPLALSPTPVAIGEPGSFFLDINQLSAMFVRLTYTKTSGAGTLNAYIAAKRLGG